MADEGNIGNNKRDIPTNNVYTFIEALKKESITTQNYPMWKEKFLSVLGGLDTQIFSIADARRERKNEIVVRVRELEEQGMDKSTPGFDVALDLLQIMPDYEKEINIRGVQTEAFLAMFVLSTDIIETMRGLGISEEVIKGQQKFLDDNWNRTHDMFKNQIAGDMSHYKEQMTVQINNNKELISVQLAHAKETTDKLLESLDVKDKILKDMMKKINFSNVHAQPQDSHTHTPQDSHKQTPPQSSPPRPPLVRTTESNTQTRKTETFPGHQDVEKQPIIMGSEIKPVDLPQIEHTEHTQDETDIPIPVLTDEVTVNEPRKIRLSDFQKSILKLYKEGYKQKEIAEKLDSKAGTVGFHLRKFKTMGYSVD